MNKQIEDLVREAALLELPADPLPPQRQERIKLMTMKKIKNEQPQPAKHRRRPVTILVAVAAALALLCGTALAAYELKLFTFSQLFGDQASIIEEAAVTYAPPSEEDIAPACFGRRSEKT